MSKRILFIGDIVGQPGRQCLQSLLSNTIRSRQIDLVVANGENAAGGSGINRSIAESIKRFGVDAITLGDHVWDQKGFEHEIESLPFVCRPANLPTSCPGRDALIIEKDGFRLGIFTVLGRHFMKIEADHPFFSADRMIDRLKGQCDAILTEIHAEATSEKVAMGHYLDGRVSLVVGTHTHIPTADAIILPRGTAYMTDAGMTGPYHSVLGREIDAVMGRMLDGMPRRFPVANKRVMLCGCIVTIGENAVAESIEAIQLPCRSTPTLSEGL